MLTYEEYVEALIDSGAFDPDEGDALGTVHAVAEELYQMVTECEYLTDALAHYYLALAICSAHVAPESLPVAFEWCAISMREWLDHDGKSVPKNLTESVFSAVSAAIAKNLEVLEGVIG